MVLYSGFGLEWLGKLSKVHECPRPTQKILILLGLWEAQSLGYVCVF